MSGGEAWDVDISGGRRNSLSSRGAAPSLSSSRVPSQSPGPTGSRFARPGVGARATDDLSSASPSKNPVPVTSSSRKDFPVGTIVRVKRKNLPGYDDDVEIIRKHPEGTYDVRYKTGLSEKEVLANLVNCLEYLCSHCHPRIIPEAVLAKLLQHRYLESNCILNSAFRLYLAIQLVNEFRCNCNTN
jgi:hypothetical protein